jgi:hypothetical protein
MKKRKSLGSSVEQILTGTTSEEERPTVEQGLKEGLIRHTVIFTRENFEILRALTYYRKIAELKPNTTQTQILNEIFEFYKKNNKSLIEKALDLYRKINPEET